MLIDERERLETLCGAERLYEAQQSLQEALAQNEAWNLFGQENNGFLFILVTVEFCLGTIGEEPDGETILKTATPRNSFEETWTWQGSASSRAMLTQQMQMPQSIGSAVKGFTKRRRLRELLWHLAFGRKPPFFHRRRVDSYHLLPPCSSK